MAEATLAITFADVTAPLKTDRVDLAAMRAAKAKPASGGPSVELVSCGRPFAGHELVIMGKDGERRDEREIGEVWLRGPSVTAGYFQNREATEEAFRGGYLRTGDLGYIADRELEL